MQRTTDKIIQRIKEYLERCLDELYEETETNDFIYGAKSAYVECLELLQSLKSSKRLGLHYNIEEKYPLAPTSATFGVK